MIDVAFGTRLRAAREAAGLTQAELAAAVKRSRAQITNLELGNSETSASLLRAICVELGVSADTLLGLEVATEATRKAARIRRTEQRLLAQAARIQAQIQGCRDELQALRSQSPAKETQG